MSKRNGDLNTTFVERSFDELKVSFPAAALAGVSCISAHSAQR